MKIKTALTLVILIGFGIIYSNNALAQDNTVSKAEKKELKKEKRKKRKAERKLSEEFRHAEASKALKDYNFVLEANTLYTKKGRSIDVSNNLNFISINGDDAELQLAFRNFKGLNGLGGITLKGTISNKKYKIDKHGNESLSFSVMGPILLVEVRINLGAYDNYADAEVDATTRSRKLKFRGNLISSDKSKVYKSGIKY